ncbi:unnamed protein product [Rhizoctonia solani]|uniref:Uncharacterized protein n=1 Tax=Rhizoctonia solani TaxID=456999 RepID=A0A8H3BPY5_9AGAM|nr:unnamed protein product [Rhizoctonia solani]
MDQDEYETLLELTAQCQLMDLEELRAGIKGKARAGSPSSDLDLTYLAMEAEAKATLQYVQDRRIARGVEGATREDIDLINTIAEIERQEQADRQYALALSTNPDAAPPSPPAALAPSILAPRPNFSFGSAYRNGQQETPSILAPRPNFSFGSAYRNNQKESPSGSSSGSSWLWSASKASVSSPSSRSSQSSIYDSPKPQASTSTSKPTFVPSILRLPPGRYVFYLYLPSIVSSAEILQLRHTKRRVAVFMIAGALRNFLTRPPSTSRCSLQDAAANKYPSLKFDRFSRLNWSKNSRQSRKSSRRPTDYTAITLLAQDS